MIERVIPVAAHEEITTFRNLFFSKAHKSFSDSHLWLSVFLRPSRSNFTRVQRISCILSLVLLTMLSNALFYKADVENVDTVHGFTVGPFTFTLQSLFISFVSCLIVLPANIAIDQLFRKSRPKYNEVSNSWLTSRPSAPPDTHDKRKSLTDNEHIQNASTQAASSDARLRNEASTSSAALITQLVLDKETTLTTNDAEVSPSVKIASSAPGQVSKAGNSISTFPSPAFKANSVRSTISGFWPYWCVYLGWLLVFVSTATSAFFTFSFSMQWGREKSNAWLTAMLLSIGESVAVIQPTKVRFFFSKPSLNTTPRSSGIALYRRNCFNIFTIERGIVALDLCNSLKLEN